MKSTEKSRCAPRGDFWQQEVWMAPGAAIRRDETSGVEFCVALAGTSATGDSARRKVPETLSLPLQPRLAVAAAPRTLRTQRPAARRRFRKRNHSIDPYCQSRFASTPPPSAERRAPPPSAERRRRGDRDAAITRNCRGRLALRLVTDRRGAAASTPATGTKPHRRHPPRSALVPARAPDSLSLLPRLASFLGGKVGREPSMHHATRLNSSVIRPVPRARVLGLIAPPAFAERSSAGESWGVFEPAGFRHSRRF
jgi:hypothetical protein